MKYSLEIKNPIPPVSNPKEVYKFYIEFMHGDADGESYEEVCVDANSEWLPYFVEFLIQCEEAFPHGMGGSDRYSWKNVPYAPLFLEYQNEYIEREYLEEEVDDYGNNILDLFDEYVEEGFPISLDIPNDITCFDGHANLRHWYVSYFDKNGIEYEVELIKK